MAFTRDIGGATYNAFSTEAPKGADHSVALGQAIGIGKEIYGREAEKSLVGEEGAQVPGLEGLGEGRIKPGKEFDMDKALNLRQIKRAKEQGLLSETQARLKVGQAIKAVAEDFPGQEEELRQRAGVYFGKFGEGDLTLTKSSAQKQQEAIYISSFIKPGVAAGFIDPNDPMNDKDGQAEWLKLTHDRTVRAQTKDVIQTNAEVGKSSALDVGNAYVASDVSDDIATAINSMVKARKEGKAITDPLEIKGLFNAQKIKHKQALRTRLARVKKSTPELRAKALAEVDNAYKDLEQMVDDGSFQKMLEQRLSTMKQIATVSGISKFPLLFEMENVAKGAGIAMLGMSDSLGRMQSKASSQAYIDRQPPLIRQMIQSSIDNPMSLGETFMDTLVSNTTTGQEWMDGLFLNTAKNSMKQPNIEEEVDKDVKDLSISYVLKNAPSIESLKDVNTPSVAVRIKKDKRKVALLTNKFVTHEGVSYTDAIDAFIKGSTASRQSNLVFNPNTRKFEVGIATTRPTGLSSKIWPEESQAVDKLNVLYETVDYYGAEMGVDRDKWVATTLKAVNDPLEEARQAEVDVEAKAALAKKEAKEKGRAYISERAKGNTTKEE